MMNVRKVSDHVMMAEYLAGESELTAYLPFDGRQLAEGQHNRR